jgi:two-component system sensor histidine kinase KdpD
MFVPLRSGDTVVGIVCITGAPEILSLAHPGEEPVPAASPAEAHHPQGDFFTAFCDQVAFALDRARLLQEAIHAEALREGDRMKNALLGSVTHDLRTPIAAIDAATGSLLQAGMELTAEERAELLRTIAASTQRLGRLVDNLLALSRLESGTAQVEKTPYLVGDVIATVLDQLEIAGSIAGRRIAVDLEDDLLEAPMDHAQIERVMMNLVENAVKYSPPNSPIAITGRCSEAPAAVIISVRDHGIGIPPGELAAIFDKFYRLQQPLPWQRNRPPGGTGLGLAICAGIVREHGGHIWATSEPGTGTTITFTLPLASAMPSPSLTALERPDRASVEQTNEQC